MKKGSFWREKKVQQRERGELEGAERGRGRGFSKQLKTEGTMAAGGLDQVLESVSE